MATLEALAISGIRSYNPEKLQRIDFTHPITLINGKNGSGKTTIIQCLKYITTGAQPSLVNRQNCFVMDPMIAGTAEVKGDIRLRFRTAKNRVVIAKKVLMVSKKQNKKNLQSKVIQLSLKTKDQDGKQIQVSQKCTDIQKQIPQMLSISKPILNNIVFCHQDDSLWPFSENNVLKNIFDELFDTKRFTKSLQNLKQALKDYQKQKIQLKAQLQYLKIGYIKYSQSQSQSLTGLLQLLQTSKHLSQIRGQLQPLKQKIKQLSNREKEKNQLIGERGVLEYKLVEIQRKIEGIVQSGRKLGVEIRGEREGEGEEGNVKIGGNVKTGGNVKIEGNRDQNQIYVELKNVVEEIQEGQKQLRLHERVLQQIKDKQSSNKYKIQLQNQISRIKQIVPSLKSKNSYNQDQFIRQLSQKLKEMKRSQSQLTQAKHKLSKLPQPPTPIPTLTQSSLTQQQSHKQSLKSQLQKLQKTIRTLYTSLYTPNIQHMSTNTITGQNRRAAQKLSKLQAQIQLKKSQLRKYKDMKPRNKTLEREIYQYQYTYIDLQGEMLEYMKRKKECTMCMKKLSDQELENVRIKVSKTIKKGQQRIQQLKRSYNPTTDIDPQPIIKQIQKFITDNTATLSLLQKQKQQYDTYMQNQQKLKTNRQLLRLMQQTQLKSQISTTTTKIQYEGEPTLQKFRQVVAQYRALLQEYRNVCVEVSKNRDRYEMWRREEEEYQGVERKRRELLGIVQGKEGEVRYLAIVENVCRKIGELSQLVKRNQERGSSSQESSGQLINRIQSIQAHLQSKTKHKQSLQLTIQYTHLQKTKQQLTQSLCLLLTKQSQYQQHKSQTAQLQNKRNSLQLAQATLLQKQRSKRCLFQDPTSNQCPAYLQKLLRYNTLCALIGDVQVSIRCMERATNRLHNQKMDLINKILFDIWQEVYHAKDIDYIRIDAISEKKTTGYGYSIKMHKNGQLIDMKGRCSMGQKVLASIIIRMALAQAFSASTHILTLDQPTTNLDRIHIQNLAQSISSLIQMQQNSRLQLIIISHDMQFIKLLRKHASHFYQITRNQNNFSVITKRDISQLGDDGRVAGIQAVHY